MSKMLFVQSKDYWGYDASSFDEAINFYKFTWVVPEAQYAKMDEEDQKRLYPCALFYVAGVTDNHNFLTLKITQEDDEAKVSGMEGTKRRTRRYEIGTPTQYSVGSYSLQAAPVAATTISEIQEAVEAGSTSEGSFTVSAFLNDANSVAEAVNYTEEKSAETFAAPSEVPSGSAYEPADPTVANPATAGYSESELITMDNFSAEEDEYLCKYCGQDPDATFADDFWDDGVCTPCAIEHGEYEDYEAEAYNGMFFAGGTLSYTTSFTRMIEGNHKINQPYKVSYEVISGNERYSELTNEHRLTFRNMIEKDIQEQIEEEGLIDITGEEILNGEIEYIGNNGQEVSIFYDATLMPSKVKSETILNNDIEEDVEIINFDAEGGRLRDIRGKFMNRRRAKNAVFGEVMSQQMSGYYRTGIVGDNPPVGQDISRRNPAAKAAYFLQPGVEDPNRPGSWSKGPNFQQARKIAKGVAWDTVQDMGLAAETFNADSIEDDREPIYQDCLVCGESQYMNDGGVYAYDDGTDQPICYKPACVSKWKQVEAAYDKGDDEGYEVYEKLFGAETAYAELGNQEFPVVPNSQGGNTALDSGYGVPQWYGSESWEMIECGNCDATFPIDEGLDIGGIDYCEECYDTISAKDDVEYEAEIFKYQNGLMTNMKSEEEAPEEDYIITELPKEEIDRGDKSGLKNRVDGVWVNPNRGEILRAIAPIEGAYFDFYADEWEDAGWANLPDMTEDEYDACYFDFKKGGVFDGNDNLIVSMDDFAEAIFNYDIVNLAGNYEWTEWNDLPEVRHTTSRSKITETLEEASPAKGVLVGPTLVAVAGLVAGILYARRN